MSSAQQAAFAAGSGVAAAELLLGIAMIVMTLLLVWTAWVVTGQFRAWHDGQASLYDLLWTVLRTGILVLLLGWFIR